MKLFDSHCHLEDRAYDRDLDAVVKRMHEAGVAAAMVIGVNQQRSVKAVALVESLPGCYASVGIHPHSAKDCSESALAFLADLAKNPKVRAWGEIGLDFNRMFSPRKDQERWCVRQLETADELGLPVIFHERDSSGRLVEILKEHRDKLTKNGVIHCFSGNDGELKQYLDFGLYIGVTGIVTLKGRGKALRQLIPHIPADRLLVETDAPYLTPAPEINHTRRNEPAFVR
ncbi:MAG: TatD family hydrolase, partial [Deltaproteobacteria bacterium]|nr:TatD family hydrolase [Deltaproteobacteria bacterium]